MEHDHHRRVAFEAEAPEGYEPVEEEEGVDEDLDWSEDEAEEVAVREEDTEPSYDEEAAVQAALDASNLEELGQ